MLPLESLLVPRLAGALQRMTSILAAHRSLLAAFPSKWYLSVQGAKVSKGLGPTRCAEFSSEFRINWSADYLGR